MKKRILALLCTLAVQSLVAQESVEPRDPLLLEGKLFTVQLTRGAKRIDVKLAGTDVAQVGPERVEILGREIVGSKTRKLTIRPSGSFFEIVEPKGIQTPIEIEVHDKAKKQKETFRFDVKDRP